MNSFSMEKAKINLTALYKRGKEVFGSDEKFNRWLNRYNPFIGGKPSDLLNTTEGFNKILDELGRIEHGIFG